MIGGKTEGFELEFYTGFGRFKPMLVNPSKEELSELLDADIQKDQDFSIRENALTGRMERPITIWLKNIEKDFFTPITFSLSKEEVTSSSGKRRFIDSLGQITHYVESPEDIEDNPNIDWYNTKEMRPLYYGEENLYVFMQRLMGYSPKAEDANWMKDLAENGMSFEELYDGNVEGLREFVKYCNNEDCTISLLLSVKESDDRTYQQVINNPRLFFRTTKNGNIPKIAYDTLAKLEKEYAERDYKITNNFYTAHFELYKGYQNTRGQEPEPNETVVSDQKDQEEVDWSNPGF